MFYKKVVLKNLAKFTENTYARVSFFPATILRTTLLQNTSGQLQLISKLI